MKKTMIIVLATLVFALAASAVVTRIVRANQPLMPGDRVKLDDTPVAPKNPRIGTVAATMPGGGFEVRWDMNPDDPIRYGPESRDTIRRQ